MAEMSAVFQELLQILQEARTAVDIELGQLTGADTLDGDGLKQLQTSVAEFAGQAVSLAALMFHRKMNPSLIEEAEELFAFFRVVEHQIASLLGEVQAEG